MFILIYPRPPTGIVVTPRIRPLGRPVVCLPVCLSGRPERCWRKIFKISNISLQFGVVMHGTVKQITVIMTMLGYFWRAPPNFEIFQDRLGPGRWQMLGNVKKFHYIATWNFVVWCNVPRHGSLFEMAMLSQCSYFRGAIVLWTSCSKMHSARKKLSFLHYPSTWFFVLVEASGVR